MMRTLRRIARRIVRGAPASTGVNVMSSEIDEFRLPSTTLTNLLEDHEPRRICIESSQVERPRDMVLPLADLMSIAAICRVLSPARIMEIGTFTGETTWTIATNLPDSSQVFTLDLPPDEIPSFFPRYVAGSIFLGTPENARIQQLFGWSDRFDFSPYHGSMDMVFIDGDHSHAAVQTDTATALKLIRRGGIVIWDDYRYLPCHRDCCGVSDFLHSVMETIPVRQLAGTRLAVMRVG